MDDIDRKKNEKIQLKINSYLSDCSDDDIELTMEQTEEILNINEYENKMKNASILSDIKNSILDYCNDIGLPICENLDFNAIYNFLEFLITENNSV